MRVIPIIKKEVADHLSSRRFPMLILLILLSGLTTSYFGVQSIAQGPIREAEQTVIFLKLLAGRYSEAFLPETFSFVGFISLLGPIIGIALGFDSVNREMASGSMLKILSNPIHRDSVILGKIISGLLIILLIIFSSTGVVVGFNILFAGFGPSFEGVFRIVYFAIASFLYVALWFSISLLFSIIFKRTTTSALASIATWIFFSIFIYLIAHVVAAEVAGLRYYFPSPPRRALVIYNLVYYTILGISPRELYLGVASQILDPEDIRPFFASIGGFYQLVDFRVEMLDLDASLALVWPSFSALIASFVIVLTLSTLIFLRMEIRPSWA